MIFQESETLELKEIIDENIKKAIIAFANYKGGTIYAGVKDDGKIVFIKETDGDNFEEMRSTEQNLTFNALSKEFKLRNLDFEAKQKQTLKILNQDGIYINMGLLLSDQCIHSVKAAVFEGMDQSIFKDRKEFSGSLIQQLNDIYNYIDMHNQTRSTFDKLLRVDTRDYPSSLKPTEQV